MTYQDNIFASPQEQSVRFTSKGKEKFRFLGGSLQRSEWSFKVSIPAREGRTQKELVGEIRDLAVEEIFKACQRDGLKVSFEDIQELNSHEYLE